MNTMKPTIPQDKDCRIYLLEKGDKFYIFKQNQLYAVKVLSVVYGTQDLRAYSSRLEYYIPNGKFLVKTKDSEIEVQGSVQTRGNKVTLLCNLSGEPYGTDDYYIYQTPEQARKEYSTLPYAHLSEITFANCQGEELSLYTGGITNGNYLAFKAWCYNSNTLEVKPYSAHIGFFTLDVKKKLAFPTDSKGGEKRNLNYWKTAYDVRQYIEAQKEKMVVNDFEEKKPEEKKSTVITVGNITTSVSEADRLKIMKILFPE